MMTDLVDLAILPKSLLTLPGISACS